MHVIMSSGIDPMSGEPVYRQLAVIIRSKIESGEYPPGAPLPSAKSMAQEHGISVGAVTRAVDVIRAEGLARTVPGRGVWVLPRS
jgi:GntR family transcriptional regulator